MRVCIVSAKRFERPFFERANTAHQHELIFIEAALNSHTAAMARGCPAVCAFVNDELNQATLTNLHSGGTRLIALRSAGFNQVDLHAADRLGLTVLRVPAYSPQSVAEHAVALMLTLNRKIHRAYARVREGNFSLDGLMGFDMQGKIVGVIGTGRIGTTIARILAGFGCRLLGYDIAPNQACVSVGMRYVGLGELFRNAHIITLHCPLTPKTHHLIDTAAIDQMRDGVMFINTSRGRVVDTQALIDGLKSGKIGSLGLDVYEEEESLFFRDLSNQVIQDDVFARLLTFPNVIITAHQAFFTHEAMEQIASTTLQNITDFERKTIKPENIVNGQLVAQ
jgi:D-lactate dehydrogenase